MNLDFPYRKIFCGKPTVGVAHGYYGSGRWPDVISIKVVGWAYLNRSSVAVPSTSVQAPPLTPDGGEGEARIGDLY